MGLVGSSVGPPFPHGILARSRRTDRRTRSFKEVTNREWTYGL